MQMLGKHSLIFIISFPLKQQNNYKSEENRREKLSSFTMKYILEYILDIDKQLNQL